MDPHGKTTRPGLPHMGMSHGRFNLAGLTTAFSNRTRACHTSLSLPNPSLVQFRKGQF
ncbi:Activating molecule in BECN1-regulated autophagy 1 [Gossypium arboreum]|uniref:Activating molecule in BECN1-regulated autophagy 1 n=1 Tax=Gossypium arboreum TaxID=29729 RepID=A0A0B0MEQ5_GOSAR|nr:Activating molecule in BECN1-regulated autophagy 1 [Gossypium arboreum]